VKVETCKRTYYFDFDAVCSYDCFRKSGRSAILSILTCLVTNFYCHACKCRAELIKKANGTLFPEEVGFHPSKLLRRVCTLPM
jgi:hypothetical protein